MSRKRGKKKNKTRWWWWWPFVDQSIIESRPGGSRQLRQPHTKKEFSEHKMIEHCRPGSGLEKKLERRGTRSPRRFRFFFKMKTKSVDDESNNKKTRSSSKVRVFSSMNIEMKAWKIETKNKQFANISLTSFCFLNRRLLVLSIGKSSGASTCQIYKKRATTNPRLGRFHVWRAWRNGMTWPLVPITRSTTWKNSTSALRLFRPNDKRETLLGHVANDDINR